MNYTNLTFTEIVNKIEKSRFFNLPRMLAEAFRKIPAPSEPSYKVYTALVSQAGTDAPQAIVLENTLGGEVVWTRADTGEYYATLTGAFSDELKVAIMPVSGAVTTTVGVDTFILITDSYWNDENSIGYLTALTSVLDTTAGDNPFSDNVWNSEVVEIRVYN